MQRQCDQRKQRVPVSASSDIAERVELHTHLMDGDVMMMREVEAYDLPAGESVTLEPMGHHIMLFDLDHRLNAGEHFPVTISFQMHDPVIVDVKIVNPGE